MSSPMNQSGVTEGSRPFWSAQNSVAVPRMSEKLSLSAPGSSW